MGELVSVSSSLIGSTSPSPISTSPLALGRFRPRELSKRPPWSEDFHSPAHPHMRIALPSRRAPSILQSFTGHVWAFASQAQTRDETSVTASPRLERSRVLRVKERFKRIRVSGVVTPPCPTFHDHHPRILVLLRLPDLKQRQLVWSGPGHRPRAYRRTRTSGSSSRRQPGGIRSGYLGSGDRGLSLPTFTSLLYVHTIRMNTADHAFAYSPAHTPAHSRQLCLSPLQT